MTLGKYLFTIPIITIYVLAILMTTVSNLLLVVFNTYNCICTFTKQLKLIFFLLTNVVNPSYLDCTGHTWDIWLKSVCQGSDESSLWRRKNTLKSRKGNSPAKWVTCNLGCGGIIWVLCISRTIWDYLSGDKTSYVRYIFSNHQFDPLLILKNLIFTSGKTGNPVNSRKLTSLPRGKIPQTQAWAVFKPTTWSFVVQWSYHWIIGMPCLLFINC